MSTSSWTTQKTQRAAVWYPGPTPDIRVEDVPMPKLDDPDDAIVKITLGGLCGSDLHVYRGHGEFTDPMVMGHEFIGTVVALGSNFIHGDLASRVHAKTDGRPELYASLKVGDKVVSPFTISCGECHYCRVGFTCRCPSGKLIGTPTFPGGQAQYIRVPKAGGTLYNLSSPSFYSALGLKEAKIDDSSLLLMADILPTGVFAATQALGHGKLRPLIKGDLYPAIKENTTSVLSVEDRKLTIAVIGLGPVGMCACVSLLDMLEDARAQGGPTYKIIAIDRNDARRTKMQEMHKKILASSAPSAASSTEFVVGDPDTVKSLVSNSCEAVLEVVGNPSALTLAYTLVRPFGLITSIGVHSGATLPFTGRELYAKNVSLDFGRCPVRAMFGQAFRILIKRQDIFGGSQGLVEKVVPIEEAKEWYKEFEAGRVGKVLFDPWK